MWKIAICLVKTAIFNPRIYFALHIYISFLFLLPLLHNIRHSIWWPTNFLYWTFLVCFMASTLEANINTSSGNYVCCIQCSSHLWLWVIYLLFKRTKCFLYRKVPSSCKKICLSVVVAKTPFFNMIRPNKLSKTKGTLGWKIYFF